MMSDFWSTFINSGSSLSLSSSYQSHLLLWEFIALMVEWYLPHFQHVPLLIVLFPFLLTFCKEGQNLSKHLSTYFTQKMAQKSDPNIPSEISNPSTIDLMAWMVGEISQENRWGNLYGICSNSDHCILLFVACTAIAVHELSSVILIWLCQYCFPVDQCMPP